MFSIFEKDNFNYYGGDILSEIHSSKYLYADILNKLNNNNKLVKKTAHHTILVGYNQFTKSADVELDEYSLEKYLELKFADLWTKYNVSHLNSSLSLTFMGLVNSMKANSAAIVVANEKHHENYNKMLNNLRKFTTISRENYLSNFNEALKTTFMDEHSFIHYLLAGDLAVQEHNRKCVVFDLNYSHVLSWKHVYEEEGNPLCIKNNANYYKKEVTDRLDHFIFYYDKLYSLDMDPVFQASDKEPSGNFKNAKFYGSFYASNTYSNPTWKVNGVKKTSSLLYSQAFFHLINHLNKVSPEILSKFSINEQTLQTIKYSFDEYLYDDVEGFTTEFKNHIFGILDKIVVRF